MTVSPSNPAPPHGDDELLLALVESLPLAPGPAGEAHARLTRDPALACLVEALRADRAGLAALPVEPAPPGLVEAAEAAAQRLALLALTEPSLAAPPPQSAVVPARPGRLETVLASPWLRPALAAAAIVAIGAASALLYPALRGRPDRPLAAANQVADEVRIAMSPAPEAGRAVASSPSPPTTTDELLGVPVVDAAASAPGAADAASLAPSEAPAAPALSPERAAELARDGRLAIVLTTADVAGAQARLESLAARAGSTARWTALDPADASAVLAIAPAPTPDAAPGHAPRGPVATAGRSTGLPAEASEPAPLVMSEESVPPAPARSAPVAVTLPLRPDLLETLRRALDDGARREARFVELDVPHALEPALDAPGVFWWTSAPGAWVPRAAVPLVIVEAPPQRRP